MMIQTLIVSILLANPQALLETAESNIAAKNWSEVAKDLDEYVRTVEYPSAEAMYDLGIAHYNLGAYDVAANDFEESMAISNNPMLQTYSAFNLGNAIYRQTLESLEGTGTGAPSDEAIIALVDAKSQINHVLKSYRSAIAIDPSDMDARANGELAWQMLQQLNQKQEQDEKSADQQQENQEQKDDGSSEEQQKQDGEQSDEGEESKEHKHQEGEHTEQDQQLNQQQDGEQSEQEQQQNQQQQDGEHSNQEQQPPDGELESTDEEMNEIKLPSTSLKDEGERLSEDEANRLLQLIRDKEQQRRKTIAARRAANRVPVGKDW